MTIEEPKATHTTASVSALTGTTDNTEDDVVVLDSLKAQLHSVSGVGNSEREHALTASTEQTDGPVVDEASQRRYVTAPVDENRRESAAQIVSRREPSPSLYPSDITTLHDARPCAVCQQLTHRCVRGFPLCGCSSPTSSERCTWDGLANRSQPLPVPQNGHLRQLYPRSHSDRTHPFGFSPSRKANSRLEFSTLESYGTHLNSDFDAFLGSVQDQALTCNASTGEGECDLEYWRNTVGVAEPSPDVERPRPRPRGI